jgi:hypothetical protein
MKRNFLIAVSLFALVALGAWLARSLGFYNTYWYTDIILHLISGLAAGFIWLGLNRKVEKRKWMLMLEAGSFALFLSVIWELWEFAGWRITPSQMRFYIPELGDTLGDLCCGFVGGLFAGLRKSC